MKKVILMLAALLGSQANAQAVTDNQFNDIKSKFEQYFPFEVKAVEPSAIEGVLQIVTPKGVFYVSDDGEHFLQGSLYKFTDGFRNLTNERMAPLKKESFEDAEKYMVKFKAPNERASITVFTDVTCGYCSKLHHEIPELHSYGITVNYISYSRSQLKGPGYEKNRNVWCASDKAGAFNMAFNNEMVPANVCDANMDEMQKVGTLFKVNGTPAIVLDDMSMIPGYRPAADIAKQLGLSKKS